MGVRIYWNANQESDIAKYYIYRQNVVTGEIEKIDEVQHPVSEYTDPDGSSAYRYYVSAVDIAQNESLLAGPVRLPPSNMECQIYENLKTPEGQPAQGKEFIFRIISLPYDYAGYLWSGQEIKKLSDQDGLLEIFLPRLAVIQVLSAEFGINKTITIPDSAACRLFDLIR